MAEHSDPHYRVQIVGHPRLRMEQRGITVDDIDRVLHKHFRDFPTPENNSWCLEGVASKGVLKVWVMEPWPPMDAVVVVKSCAWEGR